MFEQAWTNKATNVLKAEIKRSGIGYEELVKRLSAIGVDESYKGLANKINRGSFTFIFFMQCMKALDKSSIRLDDE